MTVHGMQFRLEGQQPVIAEGAYVAPSAMLIGDVRIGPQASVWFGGCYAATTNRSSSVPAATYRTTAYFMPTQDFLSISRKTSAQATSPCCMAAGSAPDR